jgi:hypothetical protein
MKTVISKQTNNLTSLLGLKAEQRFSLGLMLKEIHKLKPDEEGQ